jgi:hypothetical protein
MSVDINSLFQRKVRQFATSGGGNERFAEDFVDALREAVNTLNMRYQLGLTVPDDYNTVLDMDGSGYTGDDFEQILSRGIDVGLMRHGQQFDTAPNARVAYKLTDAEAAFEKAMGNLQMHIVLSGSDDDEDDVIGLGYKG